MIPAVCDIETAAPRLARVIGVGALTAAAVNGIVGSGIFGLPGVAAGMMGAQAVLAYAVCAVLIGLVGLCFAECGSRVSDAGGLYAYATVAFGPIVGGIARPCARLSRRADRLPSSPWRRLQGRSSCT